MKLSIPLFMATIFFMAMLINLCEGQAQVLDYPDPKASCHNGGCFTGGKGPGRRRRQAGESADDEQPSQEEDAFPESMEAE